jgi:hypothetical protein
MCIFNTTSTHSSGCPHDRKSFESHCFHIVTFIQTNEGCVELTTLESYSKAYLRNACCASTSRTASQSNTSRCAPNTSPYPTNHILQPSTHVHAHSHRRAAAACSRVRRGRRALQSCIHSRAARAVTAPASEAGSGGSDHTFAGRDADVHAPVDSAGACVDAWPDADADDNNEGEASAAKQAWWVRRCHRAQHRSVGLPALVASVTSQTNPLAPPLGCFPCTAAATYVLRSVRAELGGDDGAEGLCALGVEWLVG